jgi:hypothetical protein
MNKEERFDNIKNMLLDLIDEIRLPDKGSEYYNISEDEYNTRLSGLVEALQVMEAYPKETVEGNPNTILTMVKGYGARWFEWREPFQCTNCKADLRDHKAGPPFKREVGVVENDRVKHFVCPDCKVPLNCVINNFWSGVCKNHTHSCIIKH